MNNLLIFYKDNQRVNDILNVERNDISIYNELRTLLEIESDIYVLLSPILDDSELIELVDTLNKTSYPKESDFKKAFDLINNNGNLFLVRYPQIISKVNKFIIDRKSILLDATKNSFIDLPENMNDNLSAVIQEDIIRLKQQVEVSKKMVETLEPQIDAAQKDLDLVDKIKLEVSEFIPIYKTLVNSLVNEAFDPVRDTVETILNDYLKTEKNLSLKIVRKEIISEVEGEKFANNTIVALLEYIDQQTGEKKTITPDLYFNTFRYKLFCLMVSLSLALATRRKYEINLPLIMDDLFYASDFINKHSFSKFIIQVINLFYKYTPNLPLQFVIFTHDDLIFKSAIDSLSVKCS
jgi:hypothetical protein